MGAAICYWSGDAEEMANTQRRRTPCSFQSGQLQKKSFISKISSAEEIYE